MLLILQVRQQQMPNLLSVQVQRDVCVASVATPDTTKRPALQRMSDFMSGPILYSMDLFYLCEPFKPLFHVQLHGIYMLITVHIIHITNVVTIPSYNVKTVVNNPLIFCSKVVICLKNQNYFEEKMHIPPLFFLCHGTNRG